MTAGITFEEDRGPSRGAEHPSVFVLALDGFDGPIDLLLALARDQKVDLTRISILGLADQYLAFIAGARSLKLEIAADYLVMAAWLAYLKSRLLLPAAEDDDELSAEEMAAALAFQLRRLEAMREAGERLFAGSLLGRDVLPRGTPDNFGTEVESVFEISLYELLKAYAGQHRRLHARTMEIEPSGLYSVEEAMRRLNEMLGAVPEWATLVSFLPADLAGEPASLLRRSALASTFAASLELVKEGEVRMRQAQAFGPLYLRKTPRRT